MTALSTGGPTCKGLSARATSFSSSCPLRAGKQRRCVKISSFEISGWSVLQVRSSGSLGETAASDERAAEGV